MGKVFAIRCPECGHEFQQFKGVGMRGASQVRGRRTPTSSAAPSEATSSTLPQRDEEDLLEEEDIIEAIEGLNGVLCGEYTSVEDQAYVFNRANGTDIDEYYWYEDSDCPADPDEMKSLDDFYWDTYDFEGETYYLVDDTINEADQEHEGKKWGIGAYGDPDDDGMFDCVIPLFDVEEDTVVDIMYTDEMLNNEGELE